MSSIPITTSEDMRKRKGFSYQPTDAFSIPRPCLDHSHFFFDFDFDFGFDLFICLISERISAFGLEIVILELAINSKFKFII